MCEKTFRNFHLVFSLAEPLGPGPVVVVIIVVIIILLVVVVAIVARSKGMLCFAGKKKHRIVHNIGASARYLLPRRLSLFIDGGLGTGECSK